MRVLVCGGRFFENGDWLYRVLDEIHAETPITCLMQGGAMGADFLAHHWARDRRIPDHPTFHADWQAYGKAAGPIRNAKMLREGKPDLVVAFPGGSGTDNMASLARKAGVEVRVVSHKGVAE